MVSSGVWAVKDDTRQRWSGVSVNCVRVWRVEQWVWDDGCGEGRGEDLSMGVEG